MRDSLTVSGRGQITLPAAIRKELGLANGDYLDMQGIEGGAVVLQPVEIFRTVRLAKQGLTKLNEARQSGAAQMPTWLVEEMKDQRYPLKNHRISSSQS